MIVEQPEHIGDSINIVHVKTACQLMSVKDDLSTGPVPT